MIRGTTPTLTFTLPFDVGILENVYITFKGYGNGGFEKQLTDCIAQGNQLILKLSQTDTLQLAADQHVQIQIRAKTKNQEALASNIMTAAVSRILKDGEI